MLYPLKSKLVNPLIVYLKNYGKDTLRPCTIRQLHSAHHPHPDAEYFLIDGSETTQITFVAQVRAISTQTTNITYKLDDGTGIIEAKVWIDSDTINDENDPSNSRPKPVEGGYARVHGRLKAFNNKRHALANVIRPVQDLNEVQCHLLEATAVHLHFTRGPLESLQANSGDSKAKMGQQNGGGGMDMGGSMDRPLPATMSVAARRVYQCIKTTPQSNEGLHMQAIAMNTGMEVSEVFKGGEELSGAGLIYTTVDDNTWALMDV